MFQSIEVQQPSVPRALDFEVPRARLLERLQKHQNARVKVLAAPSGYGKTTLVAQAVRELKSEVVWLQVVPDDADVFHFVQSLHTAIFQSRWQDSELATLLATNPSTGALSAALKRVLFNSEPLELVLDNAEHLSQETRAFLSDILEADLGLTKFWVIGYDLEHLRLARLVGRGAAVILTQDDMRFDAAETQYVLEAHQSSENPNEVFTKLDGWCAGVGLIAVGVSPHITPTNLIFDAISQLPSKLRDALPEAAVLEVWNETAARNLGCELPMGWLAEVRRAGLPLTQIKPDTYRPHLTLLEALEQQLQNNPPRHQELHLAAARDSTARNESLSAIRHSLIAKDRVFAMEIAESFVTRLSARGEHSLVRSVLEEIGMPLNAALSGLLGVALINIGATEQGESLLQTLQASSNLTPHAMFALGKLAVRRRQPEKALEYAIQGQQLPGTPLELGRCRRLEGWALFDLGQLEEARKCAELEVSRTELEQNLEELTQALILVARVYAGLGDHAARERSLLRSISVSNELGNLTYAANAWNSLADLHRLQGKFEVALAELEHSISDVEPLDNEVLPFLYDSIGDVHLWQGNDDLASVAYRKAIASAKRLGHSSAIPMMQLKLVGAMLAKEHQAALSLLEMIEVSNDLAGLKNFMQGLAFFETEPTRAEQAFEKASNQLEPEWMVRVSVLQAELARRSGKLEHFHVAAITKNLEAHGFDTALFVDAQFTIPTLQFLARSGWLPTRLNERILTPEEMLSASSLDRVKLEIQTLGQRRVTINAQTVTVHLAKSFEVLVFLARNGPSSREAILEAIWNADDLQSQRYFKVALRRLRADLKAHSAVEFETVPFDERYALSSQFDTQLDLSRLEQAVFGSVDKSLESTLAGIQGEFLPGVSSEWTDEQRELSLEYSLVGHIKLGNALLESEPLKAAEVFRQALMLDPFNGGCLVNLATALLAANDRVAAQQAVERYVLKLRRELNVDLDSAIRLRLETIGLRLV